MNKILGGLLIVFLLHGLVQAADKIRIGYPSTVGHFITLPLAQKKGFLREEGVDAEILRIRPQAAVPALANGEIDYYAGVGPVVTAAISGSFGATRGHIRAYISDYTDCTTGV